MNMVWVRFGVIAVSFGMLSDEDKCSGKNVSQRLETFAEAKTCSKSYLQGHFHRRKPQVISGIPVSRLPGGCVNSFLNSI
jgi:hypothetical protein